MLNRAPWQRTWGVLSAVAALCLLGAAPLYAQQSTDFLKAEGAPVSVASYLEKGLRKHVASLKQYKLLGNPMAPGMAQLTLGCTLDSAGCVARLAKMRSAKVVFHLRVLPFGSRAKAIFRKLDGASGKTLKTVSYRFRRRKLKQALATLKTRMFGGAAPAARTAPVARRAAPPARRAVAVARRTPPPVRRAAAVVARRAAPVARRVEPAVRRAAVVARRAAPAARRAVVVARRAVPMVRRPDPRAMARPMPRRPTVVARRTPPPRRIDTPPALGTPKTPDRRVATAKRAKPKPASVPLYKQPTVWAWVAVGVAGLALAGTIGFGVDAQAKEGEIKQLIERSKQGDQISYKQNVQPLEESGKTSATLANVFIGISAAAAVTAVVLFFIPKPKPPTPSTASIKPQAAPGHPSFANFHEKF